MEGYGATGMRARIDTGVSIVEWLIRDAQDTAGDNVPERVSALRRLAPVIADVRDSIEREVYVKLAAKSLYLDEPQVRMALREHQSHTARAARESPFNDDARRRPALTPIANEGDAPVESRQKVLANALEAVLVRPELLDTADADALREEMSPEFQALLEQGAPARGLPLNEEEAALIRPLGLLTAKPIIYATNVSEDDLASGNAFVEEVRELANREGAETVLISAQVEAELIELPEEERAEFLAGLGVEEGGLQSLIRATYRLLGLRTYFTTGEKETRAWTIQAGMTAPQAAGVIHTDFERGFIRAQTVAYDQLIEAGSLAEARNRGWLRAEGKDYVVAEGDVMEFLFNV
jgi:DNA primase